MLQADPSLESGFSNPSPSRHTAPAWVIKAVDGGKREQRGSDFGLKATIQNGDNFTLVSARIAGARHMGAAQLRKRTEEAYRMFFDSIGSRCLIRVWNFIPGLLEPVGESPQRYMVFNAGRHDAFCRHFNGSQHFGTVIPTASGVGTSSDDLEIHALASDSMGTALTNVRQIDSFHYSQKYGPSPPCFARATAVAWPHHTHRRLLVGGTASVRGEETMFGDNLESQILETFKNLAAVVAAGMGNPDLDIEDRFVRNDLLARFRHVRVYFNLSHNCQAVTWSTNEVFPNAEPIEFAMADLCREGLLVEIEGWADLS